MVKSVCSSEPTESTRDTPRSRGDDDMDFESRRHSLFSVESGGSAPMMHRSMSVPSASWHTGGGSQYSTPERSWRPLAEAWRQWDSDESDDSDGEERSCKAAVFRNSCVPHWGRDAKIRTRGLIAHELTWAYYRMRRHEQHPQRKAVGEFLNKDELPDKMRFGKGCIFQFWRDLRPPFTVKSVKRVDNGDDKGRDTELSHSVHHPDGELHYVHYECPIDYFAERLMEDKKDASTFDNKIQGVAHVRIPNNYPQKSRQLHIVSWGQPTLNPPDDWDLETTARKMIRPEKVMPPLPVTAKLCEPSLRDKIGIRPFDERVATFRKDRRDMKTKLVKVHELKELQLGAASLPRLSRSASAAGAAAAAAAAMAQENGGKPARKHRIYTPAVGFVSYTG